MADQNMDDDSQTGPLDDSIIKPEPAERESTQVCPLNYYHYYPHL